MGTGQRRVRHEQACCHAWKVGKEMQGNGETLS